MKKEIKIFLGGKLKCIIPDSASAPAIIENVRDLYKEQGEITTAPLESEDWSNFEKEEVVGRVGK